MTRVAKYQIIKDDILNKISKGELKPGDRINSENELKKIYDVSSTTVIKALNDLIFEGYIVRKQGLGSYVRKNLTFKSVKLSERMKKGVLNNNFKEKNLSFVWEPDFKEKSLERIKQDISKEKLSKVVCVTQIGWINDKMWKLQNKFFIDKKFDEVKVEKIEKGESISGVLNLGEIILYPMEMKIFCEKFSPGEKLEKILKEKNIDYKNFVKENVFKVKKKIYKDNILVEIEDSYYDGKYYKFDITTKD